MTSSIARSLVLRSPMLAAPLLLLPVLGGCNKDKAPQQAMAAGEVLPRSVGDDMLPYDTVQSQPSLAAPVDSATGRPSASRRGMARPPEEDEDPVVDVEPEPAGAAPDGAE